MTLERSSHDLLAPILLDLSVHARSNALRIAGSADDEEAIHDYRVALRKLRTVLRVAREVYGKRRIRALGEELGHLAEAAGAVRDEDVLRATMASLELADTERPVVDAWLQKRALRQRRRRSQLAEEVAEPGLDRALARLEKLLERGAKSHATAEELARTAIGHARADVARHELGEVDDALAMHELRIRHKRVRYLAELLASAIGPEADVLARASAKMQKRLGELHDLDMAKERVERAVSLSLATRRALLGAVARARAACAEKVRRTLRPARDLPAEPGVVD